MRSPDGDRGAKPQGPCRTPIDPALDGILWQLHAPQNAHPPMFCAHSLWPTLDVFKQSRFLVQRPQRISDRGGGPCRARRASEARRLLLGLRRARHRVAFAARDLSADTDGEADDLGCRGSAGLAPENAQPATRGRGNDLPGRGRAPSLRSCAAASCKYENAGHQDWLRVRLRREQRLHPRLPALVRHVAHRLGCGRSCRRRASAGETSGAASNWRARSMLRARTALAKRP